MFCFSFCFVWFASMVIVFWVGADKRAEQFAALNMNRVLWVKMVITFALGKPCIPGFVVGTRSVEEVFWRQHDGTAVNSQGACLAATSAANRGVEVISSFSCFIRLNESAM